MSNMIEPLKLSLATFQPDKCYPPYLNTPRSLEACRLNGVNPIELVEIPFTEFQKDHPNDLDTANRRYERVDGARRRILSNVIKDWKHLCQTGWTQETRQKPSKEAIVEAPPAAHCKLLELQAQKFRKIELDNWTQLQRQLRLEIVRADSEVKNKKILEKHEEIQKLNESTKKEFQQKRDAHIMEQILRTKEEEEERLQLIRQQQEEFHDEAKRQLEMRKETQKLEKENRERREADRVAREEYTKQIKQSILTGIENKMRNRKKMHDIREKNDEKKVKETRERRDKELEEKRKASEARLIQVREEKKRQLEEYQRMVKIVYTTYSIAIR
jgi:hypothetical protein